MALNFGGTLYRWDSAQIIALFVVAGTAAVAFIAQQGLRYLTTVQNRMFPVHFLKMKEPVLLGILMAANNAGAFVLIYYIPLFLQFARGSSPLRSGVELLPLIVLITATIMINGGVLSKTGFYKPWYVLGSLLLLVGGVLICMLISEHWLTFQTDDLTTARIDLDTSKSRLYGYQAILGVGVGCYLQSGYAVIQAVLSPTDLAYAVTYMLAGKLSSELQTASWELADRALAQLLGLVLSLSISGAVFVNRSLDRLQALFPNLPRTNLQNAISGVSGDFISSLPQQLQSQCLEIIMSSLQTVFVLVYVAGAVSLVTAVFLSVSLPQTLLIICPRILTWLFKNKKLKLERIDG
ncbi:MAG: hypothetical protein Q9222_002710 [Ikaeria aurantiellina]